VLAASTSGGDGTLQLCLSACRSLLAYGRVRDGSAAGSGAGREFTPAERCSLPPLLAAVAAQIAVREGAEDPAGVACAALGSVSELCDAKVCNRRATPA